MIHDHLYKEFYLHCTKHCIRDHPYTKPSFHCKNPPKQNKKAVTFSSFVVFPTIRCVFLTGVIPNWCQPSGFFSCFFIFFPLFSDGQLLSHSQLVRQITLIKYVLSLTCSSKACLQMLMKMNLSQWNRSNWQPIKVKKIKLPLSMLLFMWTHIVGGLFSDMAHQEWETSAVKNFM